MQIRARITKRFENSKCKALADIVLGGQFVVRGLRIVEGERGLFVAMPDIVTVKDGETGRLQEEKIEKFNSAPPEFRTKSETPTPAKKYYRDIFFPINPEARERLVSTIIEAYNHPEEPSEPTVKQ